MYKVLITQPTERGVIDRAHVRAELAELVADPSRGRTDARDITLFKSVGTALEDLAAARCVLAEAADAVTRTKVAIVAV